jgi:hypothetical protein
MPSGVPLLAHRVGILARSLGLEGLTAHRVAVGCVLLQLAIQYCLNY